MNVTGAPTLALNDGGTATYTQGSSTNTLIFTYTVAAGQNIASLAATTLNLNSATITDGTGNAVTGQSLSGLTRLARRSTPPRRQEFKSLKSTISMKRFCSAPLPAQKSPRRSPWDRHSVAKG